MIYVDLCNIKRRLRANVMIDSTTCIQIAKYKHVKQHAHKQLY